MLSQALSHEEIKFKMGKEREKRRGAGLSAYRHAGECYRMVTQRRRVTNPV